LSAQFRRYFHPAAALRLCSHSKCRAWKNNSRMPKGGVLYEDESSAGIKAVNIFETDAYE
jgi:hypothetical protein